MGASGVMAATLVCPHGAEKFENIRTHASPSVAYHLAFGAVGKHPDRRQIKWAFAIGHLTVKPIAESKERVPEGVDGIAGWFYAPIRC